MLSSTSKRPLILLPRIQMKNLTPPHPLLYSNLYWLTSFSMKDPISSSTVSPTFISKHYSWEIGFRLLFLFSLHILLCDMYLQVVAYLISCLLPMLLIFFIFSVYIHNSSFFKYALAGQSTFLTCPCFSSQIIFFFFNILKVDFFYHVSIFLFFCFSITFFFFFSVFIVSALILQFVSLLRSSLYDP